MQGSWLQTFTQLMIALVNGRKEVQEIGPNNGTQKGFYVGISKIVDL